jgi:hypothetical protein
MNGLPSRARHDAELSTAASIATASLVVELALPHETITHTVARASHVETRASLTGAFLEVPDVH